MPNDSIPPRDIATDAPPGVTRREWLYGALVLSVASLAGALTLNASLADIPSSKPLDTFMTLSEALTGKKGLSRVVGERLMQALLKGPLKTTDNLSQLAGALFAGQLNPNREAHLLAILEAWYLGVVDNVVITYEEALMFSAVSDTLVIRSYCPDKPGFWADKPNESQS